MLYRAHRHHHDTLYPSGDYLSAVYRDPPLRDRPFWVFLPPAFLLAGLCFWFLPLYLAIPLTFEMFFIAWFNDWVHTKIHTQGHWLEQYIWFRQLRYLHWLHHFKQGSNYGVTFFSADKLLGTYRAKR